MFLLMFSHKVRLGIESERKGCYNPALYVLVKKARFCNRRRLFMAVYHITIDISRYADIRMSQHMGYGFKRYMVLDHGRCV